MADVAAISFWVSVLLGPQLWWLWILVANFCYFTIKFFRSWGKDIHLLLRYSEGGWHQIGKYLVPQTVKWFRSKSKRSFTAEPNMGSFDIADLSGNHVVVLHNYDLARPADVKFTDKDGKRPKDADGKEIIKFEITKESPKVGNPSSSDFDTFAAGEAWRQGLEANKHQKVDYTFLIMALIMGALGGFMIAYIGFPQKIPIPFPVTTTVTT